MRAPCLAGLALVAGMTLAAAQEMKAPRISHPTVDWSAVVSDLNASDAFRPAPEDGDGAPVAANSDPLGTLNGVLAGRFPGLAGSVVPVLLPFDTAAFLRDRADGKAATEPGSYLTGFEGVPFFLAGPGGLRHRHHRPPSGPEGPRHHLRRPHPDSRFGRRHSLRTRRTGRPRRLAGAGGPRHGFPGIKRMFLENYVRYAFERYGVTYVVADRVPRRRRPFPTMACRDADKVAVRVLKGAADRRRRSRSGNAHRRRLPVRSSGRRPSPPSSPTTPPGDLGRAGKIKRPTSTTRSMPVSASRWRTHRRSPIPSSPAANLRHRITPTRGATISARPALSTSVSAPGGLGHQGQDLRPAYCRQRTPGGRCEPYEHDVVAVRDGAVMRAPGQQAIYVVFNAPNERVRVRYLHMPPQEARRRRHGERPHREGGRGHRPGRQFLVSRECHHLSSAFRPAGARPSTAGYSSAHT